MRSSDSLGQLAGALARAQVELVNPVKTHKASLEPTGRAGGGQTYLYAPLSAGLDIIRKALGQQEIALLQTTHVEQGHTSAEGKMLVLTTTLAHSSGEWVATTWPVCRLGDVADPKLLGAALTYARRCSLFALVGITGDDDLDAPDLAGEVPGRESGGEERQQGIRQALVHAPHVQPSDRRARSLVRSRGAVQGAVRARADATVQTTSSAASTARDKSLPSASELMGSLEGVQDEEALLRWATDALPHRVELDDPTRAALDEAFLGRARAIGADAELLAAFASAAYPERLKALTSDDHEPEAEPKREPLPFSAPLLSPQGGHDAQAL